MDRTPLHRRSAATGAIGLAVLQVAAAGVFWAGFRLGASDETSATPLTDPKPETTLTVDTNPTSPAGLQDPCAPDFQEVAACIVAATIDETGDLIIELECRNVEPDRVGFDADDVHAHIFSSDQLIESVGMPDGAVVGGGEWMVTDGIELRVNRSERESLSRTGEVCVATSTSVHTLLHLHTSCVAIGQ